MKRKKIFSALILLLAVCLSIAACTQPDGTAEPDGQEQQQVPVEEVFKLQADNIQVELGSQFEVNLMRQSGEQYYVLNDDRYSVMYEIADESIASVDAKGFVIGIAQGSTTVTVKLTVLDGSTRTFTANITVIAESEKASGADVILNQDIANLLVGYAKDIAPEVYVEGEKQQDFEVSYTSSDPSVATVENGKVQGIAVGNATLTATVKLGGKDYQQTIDITVKTLSTVEVDKDEIKLSVSGAHNTDTVTASSYSMTDGSFIRDTSAAFSYKSSDTSVFTVDEAGKLTAVGAGSATLTVQAVGKAASKNVSVTVYPFYKLIENTADFLDIDGSDAETEVYLSALKELQAAQSELATLNNKLQEDAEWAATDEASEAIASAEAVVEAKQTAFNEALKPISEKMSGYYELASDIDFTGADFNPLGLFDIAAMNSGSGYRAFTGYLNGNGYSLKNITHNAVASTYRSIVVRLGSSGHIENIGVENLLFPSSSNSYGAGLVWWNDGKVNDVYITMTINGRGSGTSNDGFGGIVNRNCGLLTSSFVIITDNAKSGIKGGIVCTNSMSYISSCLAYTNVSAPVFTNSNSMYIVSSCYVDTDIKSAAEHARGMGLSSEYWAFDNNGLPKLKNPTDVLVHNNPIEYINLGETIELPFSEASSVELVKLDGVDVTALWTLADGKLTSADTLAEGVFVLSVYSGFDVYVYPFIIQHTQHVYDLSGAESGSAIVCKGCGESTVYRKITTLEDFQAIINDMSGYYVLANDIDLGVITPIGFTSNYTDGTKFTGIFDGDGHKLTFGCWSHNIALFQTIGATGVVKNLIVNYTVRGGNPASNATVAWSNYGRVENVYATFNMASGSGNAAGEQWCSTGLVQKNMPGAIINNCVIVMNTASATNLHGITSTNYNSATISNTAVIWSTGTSAIRENSGTIENVVTYTSLEAFEEDFESFKAAGYTGTMYPTE